MCLMCTKLYVYEAGEVFLQITPVEEAVCDSCNQICFSVIFILTIQI
jgi:hypothetical protein